MFVLHWHILRAALVVLAASRSISEREVLAQTSAHPIVTEPRSEQINRYSSFEQDNSIEFLQKFIIYKFHQIGMRINAHGNAACCRFLQEV